jgi:hypothetical protein
MMSPGGGCTPRVVGFVLDEHGFPDALRKTPPSDRVAASTTAAPPLRSPARGRRFAPPAGPRGKGKVIGRYVPPELRSYFG